MKYSLQSEVLGLGRRERERLSKLLRDTQTSDVIPEEPFVIAEKLFSPCYIGGINAANYWDLTEQIFRTITVMTPNLNLIERLWKFFKKKILYNKYYEKLDDFRKGCINFFRNIESYHKELTSLMSGELESAMNILPGHLKKTKKFSETFDHFRKNYRFRPEIT